MLLFLQEHFVSAQGFEKHVIEGASALLHEPGRVGIVQLEFSPLMIHKASIAESHYTLQKQPKMKAAVELLEIIRQSGRICFQISFQTGLPFEDTSITKFEDFVRMHFQQNCPALGCASELICFPYCAENLGDEPMVKSMLRDLFSSVGCGLSEESIAASSRVFQEQIRATSHLRTRNKCPESVES